MALKQAGAMKERVLLDAIEPQGRSRGEVQKSLRCVHETFSSGESREMPSKPPVFSVTVTPQPSLGFSSLSSSAFIPDLRLKEGVITKSCSSFFLQLPPGVSRTISMPRRKSLGKTKLSNLILKSGMPILRSIFTSSLQAEIWWRGQQTT